MNNKAFVKIDAKMDDIEDVNTTENSSQQDKSISKRVDINDLKAKLAETENKQFKKNIFILSILIITLCFLGLYFSF